MWEYKIIPSDLWYNIYRKRKLENWIINVEFLNGYWSWVKRRSCARTFYNVDDAVSALVLIKKKEWKNEQQ